MLRERERTWPSAPNCHCDVFSSLKTQDKTIPPAGPMFELGEDRRFRPRPAMSALPATATKFAADRKVEMRRKADFSAVSGDFPANANADMNGRAAICCATHDCTREPGSSFPS